jgi:hypothetical protein
MAAHLTRSDSKGSNAVDSTDDDMLWNGDVRSQCKEDEGTYCEDGDSDTDW